MELSFSLSSVGRFRSRVWLVAVGFVGVVRPPNSPLFVDVEFFTFVGMLKPRDGEEGSFL